MEPANSSKVAAQTSVDVQRRAGAMMRGYVLIPPMVSYLEGLEEGKRISHLLGCRIRPLAELARRIGRDGAAFEASRLVRSHKTE
eukprot:scaffold174820_cov28-Tisochrysis_lutea.AAC.3